jgi:hypothetical protein
MGRRSFAACFMLVGCYPLVAACGGAAGGQGDRVVARIHPGLSVRPLLATPREVTAGETFTITVTTIGSGCAEAAGGTVEVRDSLVRVVPYDRVHRAKGDSACPGLAPRLLSRPLRVTLTQPGSARIRVVGVSATAAAPALDSMDAEIAVLP